MKSGFLRDAPWFPVAVALAVLVLAVYWQVLGHSFVNVDDGLYVDENPVVLRGLTLEGARWAFSTFYAANWHPLTWLSHMLDVELFGASPGPHHGVNLLIHLANTELLFFVLWRMTGGFWKGAFVAALFGVHPLHVESVAWIAERKDVLSGLFWILTMGAYHRYTLSPGIGRYLLVAALLVLGLMCKPMLVTLPFVLLLLDFWPLGRMAPSVLPASPSPTFSTRAAARLAREKVPLFFLSAAAGVVTFLAQTREEVTVPWEIFPVGQRIANAFASYVAYLGKTVWPSSLCVFYPHPAIVGGGVSPWVLGGSILLLAGISVAVVREIHRRPYLAVGWLWYLGTMVPVIGLLQVGAQAYADRYTYLPLIGVFIAAAWGVPSLLTGRRIRRFAPGVLAAATLVPLATAASVQTGYWRDSATLLNRAVSVTDRNWFAWNVLGNHYSGLGQSGKAIAAYEEALRIHPGLAETWNNLGVQYTGAGQVEKAVPCFQAAVRVMPKFARAWNNLGVAFAMLGQERQAVSSYTEALRIDADLADAWFGLGTQYARLGDYGQAVSCFREAIRINPHDSEAKNGLNDAADRLLQGRPARPGSGTRPRPDDPG